MMIELSPRRIRRMSAITALVMMGTSCTSNTSGPTTATPADSPSVASGVQPVVTLRLGTNDTEDTPAASVIGEFVDQVDSISHGTLKIEPVWRAAGVVDDWDQAVARLAESGGIDLAMIPSAAWDALGVNTMRALNAPFLVDSEPLVNTIVTGNLAAEMMSGLKAVGVTGLVMIPEGMRHVFGFDKALVAPADFNGATIRAPRSDTVYALFTALGSKTDDPAGATFDQAVEDGSLTGAESSFARAASIPGHLTATGNVTLFPKINTLVVNDQMFAGLTEGQRGTLREAAANTLEASLASMTSDQTQASEFCRTIGNVVSATDADLAALRTAVQPVYDELERDDTTKGLIERITAIKDSTPPPAPIEACDNTASINTDPATSAQAMIPAGTYNKTVTAQEATAMGIDPTVANEILGPDGKFDTSLVIADGKWTEYDYEGGTREVGDLGTYRYDDAGRWVTESYSGGCPRCITTFAWSLDGNDLTLTFADVPEQQVADDARLVMEGRYHPQSP